MLRNDKQFELLYDIAESAECAQSALICDFVRQSLRRRSALFHETSLSGSSPIALSGSSPVGLSGSSPAGLSGTPPAGQLQIGDRCVADALVANALAPVETASNLIVFDIPSLIRNRHRLKTAVLSPYTVNKHLYAAHAAAGPQMALFQAVQDSLHAADSVVAFGEDHLRLLMMLGARNAIRAPLPTVNIKPPPSRRFDLLIINHAADDKLLTALAKSVESDHALTASVVDCAQDDARAASAQQPPVNAMIHVHVGTSANVVAPWRIVDSYAQHKPVIHLVEPHARPAGLDLAQFQMSVEHNTSGLRLSCIREVVSSAKSLRDDTAMADLFRRNADRLNAAFNFAIEERMFGAVG